MSRFNRDFQLNIEVDGAVITVESPLRISFDALKSIAGGLNKATIQVFNLGEKNRLALTKDNEQIKDIPVSLFVGYDGSLELIFKGRVQRGANMKEGAEYITELYCLDGYDVVSTFVSTTTTNDSVNAILKAMPNVERGKIAPTQDLVRSKVLVGEASVLLDELITENQSWYINDQSLNILDSDQVISSFVPEVSAATGLISTPEREQSKVTFDTLMNPALKLNGLCSLVSKTAPHLNGIYKLENITYSGDNYGNTWQQTCTALLQPNFRVA